MDNLPRLKHLEIKRPVDSVEIDFNNSQTSGSSGIFKSIRSANQEVKKAMTDEMRQRGLTDDEIRHVFHI